MMMAITSLLWTILGEGGGGEVCVICNVGLEIYWSGDGYFVMDFLGGVRW